MQFLELTWRGSLPRGGKGDPTFIIYAKSWSTRSISQGTRPRKKSWTGKWSRSYAFLEGWRNCWTELNIDGDKEGRRWWRLCWRRWGGCQGLCGHEMWPTNHWLWGHWSASRWLLRQRDGLVQSGFLGEICWEAPSLRAALWPEMTIHQCPLPAQWPEPCRGSGPPPEPRLLGLEMTDYTFMSRPRALLELV